MYLDYESNRAYGQCADLFGVFDIITRFRNYSLIGAQQQMKAIYDSFEVYNNIIKERSPVPHVMPGSMGQNTDTLRA